MRAARPAHHTWTMSPAGPRLSCRADQRAASRESQPSVSAGACSSRARRVKRRSPIRCPAPAASAAMDSLRRVRTKPLRTGQSSACPARVTGPAGLGPGSGAARRAQRQPPAGMASRSAAWARLDQARPGRQAGSPEIGDGVQVAGQPGPQVLPEQRMAGAGRQRRRRSRAGAGSSAAPPRRGDAYRPSRAAR